MPCSKYSISVIIMGGQSYSQMISEYNIFQTISDHTKKTSNISLNHYSGEDSTTSPIKLSNSYTLDSNMLNWSVICSNVSYTVGSTVNMLRLGAVVKSL